ncbi:hypothetical protein CEUSTIGMA_g10136.t1 [Chlamydomonas eustigma]|uniref:Cilium assembly protein DZIP1 N-terminal domain-containing protein n=1 Tax=Chlamydomonas eustigma TaxID=1157962 RepID=A0A250XIT6_9CHLO|nr:hypothetical protein CEUSTIGMA_g10136.t1 [Chlamydomonas eustigma]|eukprot:GAX82710.1 hypothetical protein CEUSTIGMA_g10136.t1 [Chlamydomonas eustigma]
MFNSRFVFSYRVGHFDWRTLHGVDVESVIRLTDVGAVEACLETLQHGNFDNEQGLSTRNCIQVFRLLQLSIEYLNHLRTAHSRLLSNYETAAEASAGWQQAAVMYLDSGQAFIQECAEMGALSKQRLMVVDQLRADLENVDSEYNAALDELELEDQRARYFHFRKQRAELNWQQVHAVDLQELVTNVDIKAMEQVMHTVTFGSIIVEDREELTPHHFAQLVPLAQCGLDLALFQANASGLLLEQAMGRLKSACKDIPTLTTATKQLHEAITSIVLDAHSMQNHQPSTNELLSGQTSAQARRPGTAFTSLPLRRPFTADANMMGMARSTAPAAFLTAAEGPTSSTWGRPASPYQGPLALIAAAGTAGLGPAVELQGTTAELHFKTDNLEEDLRTERFKNEEMRRLLSSIRDRLSSQKPLKQSQPASMSVQGGPKGFVSTSSQSAEPEPKAASNEGALPTAGSVAMRPDMAHSSGGSFSSPQRVRITIDEDAIRKEERQKALEILSAQIGFLKKQALDQVLRRHTSQGGTDDQNVNDDARGHRFDGGSVRHGQDAQEGKISVGVTASRQGASCMIADTVRSRQTSQAGLSVTGSSNRSRAYAESGLELNNSSRSSTMMSSLLLQQQQQDEQRLLQSSALAEAAAS